MSYIRRNSGSDSTPNKADVKGPSGKFRKSASVEPRPSSLSDFGGQNRRSFGKKKSLTSFWHNLFKSNKIVEKDESQESSDDRQSTKSSSSYESVNTILSTNSFSFVNPKKYKGKPVKGKRIPVDDATLPRKQATSSSSTGNPSRRKISTFSRLGMKIGLKSKYNLQSCESLQYLHQLDDKNPGNAYVTTWNSNSSTYTLTRTFKRRAPLPPSPKPSPVDSKPSEKEPNLFETPSIPIPTEPQPSTSSSIANNPFKLQDRRRNSVGTNNEMPRIAGPSYSTKVVTSSSRYSVEGESGKPFVITAGRHRRAASEGLDSNSNNNSGTRGRIHVKGKKRAPPPPNPFGDPDATEGPISPSEPDPIQASASTTDAPINMQIKVTSSNYIQSQQPPITSSSSVQNQSQLSQSQVKTSVSIPNAPSSNREAVTSNNPEVSLGEVVTVPQVSVVVHGSVVNERHNAHESHELEDEIAQNILNDRQEQERELQQRHQVAPGPSSSPNSNTQLSVSSANSNRHTVSITTHIHQPPVTDRDVRTAKNELEALIKDNRSGSLEIQAKKVDDQVKAQLVQLKREADKSPLLFFQKQKKPTTTVHLNSSSIPLSTPNSPPPSSSQIPISSSSSLGTSQSINNNSNTANITSTSPSQSPPPPLPAKITPRPWYKRSSSSSSKNKNKNTKPITILPNFSELDREATRIVEENRRKSAEQSYNETARELISMFNEFNRDQISNGASSNDNENYANLPTAITLTANNSMSSNYPDSNRNSIVSNSIPEKPTASCTSRILATSGTNSTASAAVSSVATAPILTAVTTSVTTTNGLPSSSKDMKPLPSGNIGSSGSVEETKKLAIVQPQTKSTPNKQISSTVISIPTITTNGVSNAKLVISQHQRPQTTTASVAPMVAQPSPSVKPPATPSTTTVSANTTSSVNNPKSIFSYQSSSLFSNSISNVPKTTSSTTAIPTTMVPSSFVPGNEWSCPRCTLRNAHWRNLCDACYFRRNSPVQSTSAIFDRINAQIKASSPGPTTVAKQKTAFESPSATTNTTMVTGMVSTAVEKPTQWVKPKTSDVPPCENFLSQLPNKENLTKEGKLEGMKLHDDPEVEELDITKVRQARLAFFARTKLDQEQQQYPQINECKPNNLALAGDSGDKISGQGKITDPKERNVFTDGEDDSLDEILQLNANNCNNGPRTWKPLHLNRFRPMLESILESEGHCNLDKIYENWHLNDNNVYSYGQWTNTFMPVQDTENANINYNFNQLNCNNNLLSNSSSEEFDEQDSTMEREGKSKNRRRSSRHSYPHSQGFHLTNDNFLPGSSSYKEKKLTLEDYRKLGAIPKNYSEQNDIQQPFPTNSIERNDYNFRNFKSEENGLPPYGQLTSSNFTQSEQSFVASKLLRNLECAIANGDHRLAATLAHDLAILKANMVANKNNEPITIRVYVEDRCMQQGPFLVQVTTTMSVRELKMKIQSDWGIPEGFQKWILGRKVAENDTENLFSYELVHDSMAFLYLVTPEIDSTIGNGSLARRTDSSKKSKSVRENKDVNEAEHPTKSLSRTKKKASVDTSVQAKVAPPNAIVGYSSRSLGRQNKGSKSSKSKAIVCASACQTELIPPPSSSLTNKEKQAAEITNADPIVPRNLKSEPEIVNKTSISVVNQQQSSSIKKPPLPTPKLDQETKSSESWQVKAKETTLTPVKVAEIAAPVKPTETITSAKSTETASSMKIPGNIIPEKVLEPAVQVKGLNTQVKETESSLEGKTVELTAGVKAVETTSVKAVEATPVKQNTSPVKAQCSPAVVKDSPSVQMKTADTSVLGKIPMISNKVKAEAPVEIKAPDSIGQVKVHESFVQATKPVEPIVEKKLQNISPVKVLDSTIPVNAKVDPKPEIKEIKALPSQAVDLTNSESNGKPPTHPPRLKSSHNKDAKDRSLPNSPKMNPNMKASTLKQTTENAQSLDKPLPSAAAHLQTKNINCSHLLSGANQNQVESICKTETPPKLPPKGVNGEKKTVFSETKLLNSVPIPALKSTMTIVTETAAEGKFELVKNPIKILDNSRKTFGIKTAFGSKITPVNVEMTKNKNNSPTPSPVPRFPKYEGSKRNVSTLEGLLAKLTPSPASATVVAKGEIEAPKVERKEDSEPKDDTEILLPPWRTSLIIEEVENNIGELIAVSESENSVVLSESEVKQESGKNNSTELTIKENNGVKPIPTPRQRMDNNLKTSGETVSNHTVLSTTIDTNVTSNTTGTGSLNPETCSSLKTDVPVVADNISLNITAQQNYQLKKPSTFLQTQKKEDSFSKEASDANADAPSIFNDQSTVVAMNIAPSLPPKEPLIANNGNTESVPNWNPEPIPKRRNKFFKKTVDKTDEEITIEIRPINTNIVNSDETKKVQLSKTEEKEINSAPKIEPIYQNPNSASATGVSLVGNSQTNNSVDGYCQTTLAFPAKSSKTQPAEKRPYSPTTTASIKDTTSTTSTLNAIPNEVSSPVAVPEMIRNITNNTTINMENGQMDDLKPSEIEKDVSFKMTEEVQGAAAVVNDDKKEGNIETYLKMLQLMEKADLIYTSEVADCPVCFNTVSIGEGIVLRDCLHVFCKECLIGAVQYAEDSEVKCPFRDDSYSCNSALQEREIKAVVPPDIFEKYLARSVKLAESKMVNTFHCKTNDCTGWCIFEDDVNIFKCPVCQRKNCLTCQAIHEGIDCQQYQRELAIAAETDENAKSSRLMLEQMIQRGEALECPACHVVLLKKWGCDWVRCTYCKTEICWVTRNFRWGPGGKGDTSGGCKCGVNGIRCHPKCTYCH